MGQVNLTFGRVGGLRLSLQWRDDHGSDGPISATWGSLQLWVGDTLVWGKVRPDSQIEGVVWNWIDLLEFLGNAWPYLSEQEDLPIPVSYTGKAPYRINEFWGFARKALQSIPEDIAEEYDERLRDFLIVHDLSEGLHGIAVSPILFLRRGNQMLVGKGKHEFILDFRETMHTLEQFGEAIAGRIAERSDRRSVMALDKWRRCRHVDTSIRLAISTGRSVESVRNIFPKEVLDASNDEFYEIKAAARMIGSRLPDEQLKLLLKKITGYRKQGTFTLEPVWTNARECLAEYGDAHPAEEGYRLANMLRETLKISVRAEPEKILESWSVKIREIHVSGGWIDAIAIWGRNCVPTILLNLSGPRARSATGRRSTLAHEICHILIDIDGALPAAEVLGGNIPHLIEQRANAFAAELLIPRAHAYELVFEELRFVHSNEERLRAIGLAVDKIASTYGASHETVAWQILNSGITLALSDELVLREKLKSIIDPYKPSAAWLH